MNLESYEIKAKDSMMTFEFISQSSKRLIKKRVQFQKIEETVIYNLAFGDVIAETDRIDDKVVSNNDDRDKVLATVAKIAYLFLEKYPTAYIAVEGSTNARTRLYQIGISKNLEEIQKDLLVFGYLDSKWVLFEKNINYSAFLIMKKI
jgi:hypothetical protein